MEIYSQKDIDSKKLAEENEVEFKGNTAKYTDEYYEELIINMEFKGQTKPRKSGVNAQGWERSAKYYFTKLLEQYPRCISQANRNKIESKDFDNIIIDKTFIDCFPRYADFQGDVLRHHHIGEDGQAAAIPLTMHSKGYGQIHNVEKNNRVTSNAKNHSKKVQEALNANYIQSGDDVWCELENGPELRTIAKNKFEYIQELRLEEDLLSDFPSLKKYSQNHELLFKIKQIDAGKGTWEDFKELKKLPEFSEFISNKNFLSDEQLYAQFPEWEKYSGNQEELFNLRQLEYATRTARQTLEAGEETIGAYYENYLSLKPYSELSEYLSQKLPTNEKLIEKYNFLSTASSPELMDKIRLSEYKISITSNNGLVMLLIDKNAVPYDLFDASVETLPILSSNSSLMISMTEFLNLPTIAEMSTLYPQFAQLTALEQLQVRQIADNINMLPTEVAPVANQYFLDLLQTRSTSNYINGMPIEGFSDFLKIYSQLDPYLQSNTKLWNSLLENHKSLYENGSVSIINDSLWTDMSTAANDIKIAANNIKIAANNIKIAANNLKTYNTIQSGITKITIPIATTLMIADMLNMSINAAYEFSKGDLESGLEIIQDWGCNTGGAFLCAAGSSALLEATFGPALICLATTGPIGVAAALIISIGVPIVTTIAFSDEASEFLNLLGETINDSFVEGNFWENWHAGMNSLSDPNFWRGLVKDASGKIVNFPENWWNMWEDVGSNLYDLPENWWNCWENAGEKIYDLIHKIKNGTSSDDEIHGGNDNDQIFGFEGNDRLYGNNGNDILDGGTGDDRLEGGSGDDI
ncbi:MAG: hypothetical protein K2J08_09295, partial [Ruminococcus sp.]|nr:hypothetical protein [Ruminococcus sp.]